MTAQHPDPDPWASPDSDVHVTPPAAGAPQQPEASDQAPEGDHVTGAVTRTWFTEGGQPAPEPPEAATWRRPSTTALFGWGAGLVLVIGLITVLTMTLAGSFSASRDQAGGGGLFGGGEPETDPNAPPLAKLCPPPSGSAQPDYAEPQPPPAGKRTVDQKAGISYAAYGDPWEPWNDDWSGGDLKVHYRVGQHFITEEYSGGTYHASILSGSVPATVNDGTILDLECTGKQVTADVRRSYYPEPNRMKKIRSEKTDLGGRPAWVSIFRLHFKEDGLKATNELVGVALIDVGRVEAAVLYVSIPGTHKQYDDVVQDVIESVRPVE